jgi:hypothetical protein
MASISDIRKVHGWAWVISKQHIFNPKHGILAEQFLLNLILTPEPKPLTFIL